MSKIKTDIEIKEVEDILTTVSNETKFGRKFFLKDQFIKISLGIDTKVLSKMFEKVLIYHLTKLLDARGFEYLYNTVQNKYPDFVIKSKLCKDKYYAVDIKSSYLKSSNRINGFTLGTLNGYFKDRNSVKNIVKPYNKFIKHHCICVIYERDIEKEEIHVKYILVREKWQIANNVKGSGNTCNIGSIKSLDDLLNGNYYFNNEIDFDDYWLTYSNKSKKGARTSATKKSSSDHKEMKVVRNKEHGVWLVKDTKLIVNWSHTVIKKLRHNKQIRLSVHDIATCKKNGWKVQEESTVVPKSQPS